MGIFHTLSEIAKNNDKFKKYEQEQRDNDVQREELNRRREHKQQEIKAAQDLGKTIIDVVDIMDQHSEDIAENVETVTEPIVGLSPFIAGLIGLGASYKTLIGPAANNEKKISQAFRENPEVKNLVEKINEADKKINYEEKWGVDSWSLQSKEEIAKIKKRHPELGAKAEEFYKKYKKELKPQYRKMKLGAAITVFSTIVGFIASNIYTTKLQVESSRVARWQARKVLEDPKYFVNYTPEQIEEAKKNLENNPEYTKKDKKLKTDRLKGGLFKGLVSVIKDNRAYRKWKKSDVDESKKVDRPLTAQELEQAKKDKEVIQRIVRSINNQAEIYSQNMEVAANVIFGTTPFLGAAVGVVVSSVMNWMKIIPNFVAKQVEKYGTDGAKAAYKNLAEQKEGTKEYKAARKKFLKEFFYEPINYGEKAEKGLSKSQIIEKKLKKFTASAMLTKWGRRGVFGMVGEFFTGIAGSLIALKLQKASSRTGRYIAKRELEENPKNFIGYTDEEMQEVKDIKAPKKTFGEKVKDYALFIPNVMKNYFEYQKYKKTELKQNKMLQEELTKLNVTENQLKDAKNLQRKIFNTFEKVDDKSQEYSESMEAAVEIAQPFVYGAGMLMAVSPIIIAGYLALKGKLSAKSVINKVLTVLSGTSKITEKKWFKNYLENIAKELPEKVAQAPVNSGIWGKIFDGINLEKTPIIEILGKFAKNSTDYIKNFANLSIAEQRAVIDDLSGILKQDSPLAKRLEALRFTGDKEFEAVINALFKPSKLGKTLQEMNNNEYNDFKWKLAQLIGKKRIGWYENPNSSNIFDVLLDLPHKKLGTFLDSILNAESVKKTAKMTDKEFAQYKRDVIEPMADACREKISELSLYVEYFKQNRDIPLKEIQIKKYKTLERFFEFLNSVPKEDYAIVSKIFEEKSGALKNFSKIVDDADFERIKTYMNSFLGLDNITAGLTKNDVQKYINKFTEFTEKAKNAPQISDEMVLPVIREILAEISQEKAFLNMSKEDLYKFIDETIIPPLKDNPIWAGMKDKHKDKITNYLHETFTHPEKELIQSLKNLKIKDILPDIDPIKKIEQLEEKIKAKTDEEFAKIMLKLENDHKLASRFHVSNMDKAYILDCLAKLKKVIERMPKDEMKNIVSAMVTEMSEHPDQFIAYVQSGKIRNIFMTDGLKKAVAAAGISWTAINGAITYTIESILADLQLKSGRLGVMKALDSLDDPAYYANIEPVADSSARTPALSAPKPINLLDMLKKQV